MVGGHHWLNGHEFEQASGSRWWTGQSGELQSMGSQRVGHNWATELDWTGQYNLSPLLPHREKVFALVFPPPQICASSNQQMTRKTPIPFLVPGYKSALRTPSQCQFSLELARCFNIISHSNKLYFPLILSHVWKFFSNPHPDHNTKKKKSGSQREICTPMFIAALFTISKKLKQPKGRAIEEWIKNSIIQPQERRKLCHL